MALNKYAAIRYRIIDECIRSRSKPWPTKEELRAACEEALYGSSNGSNISMSTIEKDIWALKNESVFGYAPIAFSRLHNGYYYSDPGFSLDLPVTPEDIDLIRLALHTLNHFKESQVFHDLEAAVNKIQGRIILADRLSESNLEKSIQFEAVPESKGHEHLPVLLDAIRNRSETEFDYTPYVDGRPRHYLYHPYLLKEHKNRWYLVGKDIVNNKIRTLGLDRMTNIRSTGDIFLPPEGFNPDDFFRNSFGIGTYSGIPEEILMKLDEIQTQYILSNPLHPSQEIKSLENGSSLVRLFVIPSEELKMQILSYGSKVEVMKPDWLRTEIRETLEKAIKLYNGKSSVKQD
ncbi:MAG: WYL domain-containing protein [Bacteroidales bacterium]|jgi:predicted DNA-binding transcriptional regulator YafY